MGGEHSDEEAPTAEQPKENAQGKKKRKRSSTDEPEAKKRKT